MSDPRSDYARRARDLDDHLRNCPLCSTGGSCADGDDIAEAEYRASRRLRNPDTRTRRHVAT
jgi:hypothetical protein